MCSSLTERGARTTMDALLLGAVDYVTKPRGSASDGLKQFLDDIAAKVRAHGRPFHTRNSPATVRPAANTSPAKAALKTSTIRALCIGSSTGGPNALADVFNSLRKPLTVPILIVQHMPAMFTAMLAERLSRCSVTIPCREAQHEEPILDGHAYVAPGGKHMEVRMQNGLPVVHLHQGPPENSCRPAVDVLFRSVAEAYRGEALGVVLTGMGSDGCRGSQALAARGGRILVQDEATSVVWGMPGSVVHANAADEVLPISQIGSHLSDLLQRYRPATLRRTEKPIEAHV